jgi:hypothetical protein
MMVAAMPIAEKSVFGVYNHTDNRCNHRENIDKAIQSTSARELVKERFVLPVILHCIALTATFSNDMDDPGSNALNLNIRNALVQWKIGPKPNSLHISTYPRIYDLWKC